MCTSSYDKLWDTSRHFHFQGSIPNHSASQSIPNFPTSPVFRSRSLKLRLHYLWTNNKRYLIFLPSMEVPAQSTTTCNCWVEHNSVLRSLTMLRPLKKEPLKILAICFCYYNSTSIAFVVFFNLYPQCQYPFVINTVFKLIARILVVL